MATLTGFLTGLTLIVAIGAQNAFVLRQGLTRQHVGSVVVVCALSDVVLIVAGVAGMGTLVSAHPQLLKLFTWLGAAYLIGYGLRSLWAARQEHALVAEQSVAKGSVVATALALTWLNPHVYLDTVLMLGNLAAAQGEGLRWWFALGACLASIGWFTGLGYAARLMAPWFAKPVTWRVLDVVIGLVMLAIAATLLVGS